MSSVFQDSGAPRTEMADTRLAILARAERLFHEVGYRKTTVADIAKALRMSPANVYRFFESKKAINEAVAERMLAEMEVELGRIATRPGETAAARLRAAIGAIHAFTVERFTVDRRMHDMVEAAMTESWGVVHGHILRVNDLFGRLVAEGVAAGEFAPADPAVAARCVHAAILKFGHPGLIEQCAEEPGPTLDEMSDFILAALRGGAR